jgi:pSer/pThr/pTyr-binding forkhead associated (FHA) protein
MVHYYHGDATGISVLMSQANGDFLRGVHPAAPTGVSTQIEAGLAEILQPICTGRRSGELTFRSGESYGYLFLQQGQVVHAMCGSLEGEEAVYLMLSWPPGTFLLNSDILSHKKTISAAWEQLLFEGARRADEGAVSPPQTGPVTTPHPLTQTRAKDNQPKLIISQGDAAPQTVELLNEYTHLGRTEDNELTIPEPSISSRHCVFILSGADVMVRDLNSSNGTYVNGEPVTEVVLRPGDNIQVGVIDIKFVPGVRRPKLQPAAVTSPAPVKQSYALPPTSTIDAGTTLKLPTSYKRRTDLPVIDDSNKDKAFVSGSSAISYEQLAPDAPKQKKKSGALVWIFLILIVLVIAGTAGYFFFVQRH